MVTRLNKAISNHLSLIEKKFYSINWPDLKQWLESFEGLIEPNTDQLLPRQILSLSRIFILSMSSSIPDQIHNITLSIFNKLTRFSSHSQISLLGFSIFIYGRDLKASNLKNFLDVTIEFYTRFGDNIPFRLSILSCILNGLGEAGERSERLAGFIKQNLNDFPLITENLLWVFVIHSRNNKIPALKILKSLAQFKSDFSLILLAFESGIEHPEPRVKQITIDTIIEKYNLSSTDNSGIKKFILARIVPQIVEVSIHSRFERMQPNDDNEFAEGILVEVCRYICKREQKINLQIIEILFRPDRQNVLILERITIPILENLYRHKPEFKENDLLILNKIYTNTYKSIWAAYYLYMLDEIKLDASDCLLSLCFAIELFGSHPKYHSDILNLMHDHYDQFTPSEHLFTTFSLLINSSKSLPNNINRVFESFRDMSLSSNPSGGFYSLSSPNGQPFIQAFLRYYFIIKENLKKLKISFGVDPILYSGEAQFLLIVKILVKNKQKIQKNVFDKVWDNLDGAKIEEVCEVMADMAYSEKNWIKTVGKVLKSLDGVLKVERFVEFCLKRRRGDINGIMFKIFRICYESCKESSDRVNESCEESKNRANEIRKEDNDRAIYTRSLMARIIKQPEYFYEHAFEGLLTNLQDLDNVPGLVILYFEMIKWSLNRHTFNILQNTSVDSKLLTFMKQNLRIKEPCKVYLDLLIIISFKYLIIPNRTREINVNEAAYETIAYLCKHSAFTQCQKMLETAYELIKINLNSSAVLTLILRVIKSLNLSSKFDRSNEKEWISLLKSTSITSLGKLISNTGIVKHIIDIISIYKDLAELYIKLRLENLIPKQVINLCFQVIDDYNEYSVLTIFKEFMYLYILSGATLEWLLESLFFPTFNLFHVILHAYKALTTHEDAVTDINDIITLLSEQCKGILSSGILKNWVLCLSLHAHLNDLKILKNFVPILNLDTESLLRSMVLSINEKKKFKISLESSEERYARMLYIFQFYLFMTEREIDMCYINIDMCGDIEEIAKNVSDLDYPELLFVFIPFAQSIFRKNCNEKHYLKTKEVIAKAFVKCMENMIKASTEKQRNLKNYDFILYEFKNKDIDVIKFVVKHLKVSAYKFISFLWPDQKKRFDMIQALLKDYLNKVQSSESCSSYMFNFFAEMTLKDPGLFIKLYPQLTSLTSKPDTILKILAKKPKLVFKWCGLLNQCESHTKLFEDFRRPYIPKCSGDQRIFEQAKLLYVTSILIFSGNTDDYISPDIKRILINDIELLLEYDLTFSVACLMIMVLIMKWNLNEFFESCQRLWGVLYYKYLSMKNSNDVNQHMSMLRLVDVLLAKGFPHDFDIFFKDNPKKQDRKSSRMLVRRRSVIPETEARSMIDINEYKNALYDQFNLYFSEQHQIDEKSIKNSIVKEFSKFVSLFS